MERRQKTQKWQLFCEWYEAEEAEHVYIIGYRSPKHTVSMMLIFFAHSQRHSNVAKMEAICTWLFIYSSYRSRSRGFVAENFRCQRSVAHRFISVLPSYSRRCWLCRDCQLTFSHFMVGQSHHHHRCHKSNSCCRNYIFFAVSTTKTACQQQ